MLEALTAPDGQGVDDQRVDLLEGIERLIEAVVAGPRPLLFWRDPKQPLLAPAGRNCPLAVPRGPSAQCNSRHEIGH
jgi:hypothetical protein